STSRWLPSPSASLPAARASQCPMSSPTFSGSSSMAAATSREIEAVWRALSGNRSTPGWHSIELLGTGSCRVRAARHSPGNEEAVLVGFSKTRIAPSEQLPQGRGFRMERATLGEAGGTHQWLSIVRQPAGSLELFAAVASDICGLDRRCRPRPPDRKSTRLNSSHVKISYAVFCLKKKKNKQKSILKMSRILL